jgi:outer membrane protein assembly factor BamB/uncharacterized protein YeaC (DUF1315 family)
MSTSTFLGKYQILGELGKGGFATVYRARDPDLGRDVALKVLDPLLTRDPVWVARFRREARAVASLDHPRVVTVHEIGQAEGSLYIAMRLVEGGSLKQRIEAQGALPWDEVVRLASQIAEALDFAHGQGVLHRDLKPANVLLDPRLGAVLSDFGFASLVADNSLSISMSGGVVGTPAYIAPEVWEGDDPSTRTDIYALGCIVYELVSGQALFGGNSTPAVMRAHFQPRKLPETWPEGTPPGLSDVLLAALALEPAGRHAAAGKLSAALAGLRTDPLAEPYAQLQAAVEAGRWQEALALAGQVRAVDAGYRDVAALEEAARVGLREEQLAAPYAQLQAAVEGGRWQEALALAEQVRAADTSYRDVVALEAAALAGLEQEARTQQAVEWRAEAERALAAAEFRDAGRAAQKWQELTPGDLELADFRQRLAEAQARSALTAQPPDQPAAPSPVASPDADRSDDTAMDAASAGDEDDGVLTPAPEASQQNAATPPIPVAASRWRLALTVGGVVVALAVFILLARSILAPNQSAPSLPAIIGADSTFYFTSNRSGKREVYRFSSDGQIVQVTHTPGTGESQSPVPGPGGVLYFVSDRDRKRDIYRIDSTGAIVRVTHSPGTAESWEPAVGPDGTLYFTSDRDGTREVYQLNSSGMTLRVTNTPGARSSWSPAISPDGVLYWTSDRDGKPEVYRFDETGTAVRVTRTPGSAGSWSPAVGRDGTLYFTSHREGKTEIYRFSHDGAALRVTHTPGAAESWAPLVRRDGTLMFNSNRDGNTEVYRIESSGQVVRITNTAGSGQSWLYAESGTP